MNRQKKLKQLFKAQVKKKTSKLAPKNKNTYISKADRLKLEEQAQTDAVDGSVSGSGASAG